MRGGSSLLGGVDISGHLDIPLTLLFVLLPLLLMLRRCCTLIVAIVSHIGGHPRCCFTKVFNKVTGPSSDGGLKF